MGRMNHSRRGFLGALLAASLAPRATHGSRDRTYVVGYLSGGAPPRESIGGALAHLGYEEGRSLRYEVRVPANWEAATLAAAAGELVAAKPDVLTALGFWRVHALAAATRTIPIVSMGTPDPVAEGLAQSLRRPGGNVTGLSLGLRESVEATLRLLRRMRPSLKRAALLYAVEPAPSFFVPAAREAGIEPATIRVADPRDAERLLRPFAGESLFVTPAKDAPMQHYADVAQGMRTAVVGSVERSLMDYGLEFADPFARAAAIIDKVLRGESPAEIPFELPDRPHFRLDRAIARQLRLELPNDVLLRVTELVD